MDLLILAWEFLKIGLLSYGGGFGLISYIQKVIEKYDWLSLEQFTDMIALSQITPGPIAVNISTYVGYIVAGFFGALISTTAMIVPGFVLVMIIIKFVSKHNKSLWMDNMLDGLKAVVIALITSAIVPLGKLAFLDGNNIRWLTIVPLVYSIWASVKRKNILLILGFSGLWGILFL